MLEIVNCCFKISYYRRLSLLCWIRFLKFSFEEFLISKFEEKSLVKWSTWIDFLRWYINWRKKSDVSTSKFRNYTMKNFVKINWFFIKILLRKACLHKKSKLCLSYIMQTNFVFSDRVFHELFIWIFLKDRMKVLNLSRIIRLIKLIWIKFRFFSSSRQFRNISR